MSSPLSERNRKPRRKKGGKAPPKLARKLATPAADKPIPPPLIPRPGGRGALYAGGVLGHKGGGGRPPQAFKEFIHDILGGQVHQGQVQAILENGNHPAFSAVFGKVLIHELGIPKVKDGGEGESPHVSVDI